MQLLHLKNLMEKLRARACKTASIIILFLAYITLPDVTCIANDLPTRLSIQFVLVSSADDTGALRQWSQRLGLGIPSILYDPTLGLRNANRIKIQILDYTDPPPIIEMEKLWRETEAIQVISAMSIADGLDTIVDANLFLGNLKGRLTSPLVSIHQTIRAQEYSVNKDAVTLVTLYALAVDAHGQPAVACELLQRARLVGKDLKKPTHSLDTISEAIDTISEAIDARLRSDNCLVTP